MARPRNTVPTYLLHTTSGQARCRLNGRYVYLGPHGSAESLAAYARICTELRSAPDPAVVAGTGMATGTPDVTVSEVLLAFWKHAERHYRLADGTPTAELREYKGAFAPVRAMYCATPAAEFGPLALKAVRQKMIDVGLARTTVNNRVRRLKHVFKWAASEQLVPVGTYQALATVAGLQKGRTAAPEPEPVRPVRPEDVAAVLPHLRPAVRAMILLQQVTGMRPGEAVRIRPCDIDQSGPVWVYRPPHHKTAHRGKERAVALGPRAREILAPFTPADPASYYFSPRRVVAGLHAERAVRRETPRFPSHLTRNADRRSTTPRRVPGERYSTMTYDRAVARACRSANLVRERERVEHGPNRPPVAPWSPNQLRHLKAAELRARYGLEYVRAVLGHSFAGMADHYSRAADATLAAQVAAEAG
jgi:integrase